ncbi:MAG: phenylalanine--tRNA ligase subunit beta [Betaproteobacteria bacterium]
MQFGERWLRALVDTDLPLEELAHRLTMVGLEVEEILPVAPPLDGVVVGRVLSVAPHPQADRLKVCSVDAGQRAPLSIVCGAPNVSAGMMAPVALVGARLPPGDNGAPLLITQALVRGVASQGMLCSARELGLSADHGGLLVLDAALPVGVPLTEALGLDDRVVVLKLTPNRADCLCLVGVAREAAAICGVSPRLPVVAPVPAALEDTHPVRISAPEGCGRFTGRVIRSVNPDAPTPAWMRERLERAGRRSISALVDVTNYVMLELGRPLHVYDLDRLSGPIDVRFATEGESLELLNEQMVRLQPDMLVIADHSGPIGLAGIMGGNSTKATSATRNVFLEAAFFHPGAISGRSRRLGLSSDAGHRFERGVDFDNNVAGIERATQLILDICGGQAGPVVDHVARLPVRAPVRMRVERARRVIGIAIAEAEMAGAFQRIGLEARLERSPDGDAFVVTPPSWRFDIAIEEDLIEEVARSHGFDNIPALPPVAQSAMLPEAEGMRSLHEVRERLAALDYHEVINFSFVDADWERDLGGEYAPIAVRNPIAAQFAVMRTTLFGGLLSNIRHNVNRKLARVRLFEIGRVFLRDADAAADDWSVAGVRQPVRVAAAALGSALPEQWGEQPGRAVDVFDLKGDLEALLAPAVVAVEGQAHAALHPGRSGRVLVDGVPRGWIGELHPRWQRMFELPSPVMLFEVDAEVCQKVPEKRPAELSRFPSVRRDLAVLVDESVAVGSILATLRGSLPDRVEQVELFDVYRGKGVAEGRKSLAFRVLLQDTQKTLTDAEVDETMDLAVSILQDRFGCQLRQ